MRKGKMERWILEMVEWEHLIFGRAADEEKPTLAVAGCNSVYTLSRCSAYYDTPEEELEPFIFLLDYRRTGSRPGYESRAGSHMMYEDIVRCPTLDAYAAKIQRAWRRRQFDRRCPGVSELA